MIKVNGFELELITELTQEDFDKLIFHDTQSSLDRALGEAPATYTDKSLGFPIYYEKCRDCDKWLLHVLDSEVSRYLLAKEFGLNPQPETPTEAPSEEPTEEPTEEVTEEPTDEPTEVTD